MIKEEKKSPEVIEQELKKEGLINITGRTIRRTRERPGSIITAIIVPPISIIGTEMIVRRLIRMKSCT